MFGKLGVIELSFDNNKVQCHICGKYFKNICSSHSWRKHNLTAYEYKKLFGLCNTYGLIGTETKKKYSRCPHLLRCATAIGGRLSKEKPRLQSILVHKVAIEKNKDKIKKIMQECYKRKRINSLKRYYEIKKMREKKLRYKEIAKILGYKNAHSVMNAIYKRKFYLKERM